VRKERSMKGGVGEGRAERNRRWRRKMRNVDRYFVECGGEIGNMVTTVLAE
jgi:hypothetical protein